MGVPAQKGKQYSIRLWTKALNVVRSSGGPKTSFGGLVGNVAFPGKIMADSETQKLERKDFFKGIVQKVDWGVGGGGGSKWSFWRDIVRV